MQHVAEANDNKEMIVSMRMIDLGTTDLFTDDGRILKRFSKQWSRFLNSMEKQIERNEKEADSLIWRREIIPYKNDSQFSIETHKKKMDRERAQSLRKRADILRGQLELAKELNKLDRVLCVKECGTTLQDADQMERWIFWYHGEPVTFDEKKLLHGYPEEFPDKSMDEAEVLLSGSNL